MNKAVACTKTWCIKNRMNLTPLPALVGVGAIIYTYHSSSPFQLPLMLWIAAVVIPLILGMAEKVRFRWVLLWESIMFFPLGLVIFLIFGSAIIGIFRR